jgi:replicative DNA helicase
VNNIELALLTKVVDERDFHTLEKAKIDESFFHAPEAQEVYRYIRDMYHAQATAGCIPSRELLAAYYPTFPFFNSTDNIAVLVEQLRRSQISLQVGLLAQELMNKADIAPLEALATLRADGPRISALAERSEDYSMSAAARLLRDRYDLVSEAKGVIGIPYPWQVLNEATQGMKPQNFIVIYGRPKSMKTWFALKLAVHAYIECRRRVVFYSREMAPEELLGRAASIIAKVDYNEFLNGRLQPAVRDHLFSILNELIEDEKIAGSSNMRQPFFVVVSDRDSPDGGGISWLQAKIEEHDPDIAFVDGMYLMKDDRTKSRTVDWKNITHISQDTKLTARRFNIPVVGVTQANRGADKATGEDLTELAFADALGMDADAVFRISKHPRIDEATKRKVTELLVTAPGLREGMFEGMVIEANPGHTFNLVRVLTGLDPREREANYKEGASQQTGPHGAPRLVRRNDFTKDGRFKDPRIR